MRHLFNRNWIVSTFLICLFIAASFKATASATTVLTSTKPLGFIASAITEGIATTNVLLPDGASPHDYALKPSDVQKISNADLVLWIGPDMESFLVKSLQRIDNKKQIKLAQLPDVQPLLRKDSHEHQPHSHHHEPDHGHHHGDYDMHIWMSPEIAEKSAIALHGRLLELMPHNKMILDVNLDQFRNNLRQTKENIANIMKPLQGKGYFVFHDAYGYFEKTFGLSQLGYFTVNPEIQPGAQRLYKIRTQLIEHKAECVFAEPQFQPAVINAVVEGTNVRIGTLDPLGSNIALGKESYLQFLTQLSQQFASCLE